MREPILKAVAMPPRIFWAPMYPAIINGCMQMGIMSITVVTLHWNPIVFIPSILLGHLIIIAYAYQEPHLSKMMLTFGPMASPSKNVYYSRGNKLAP